MNSRFYFRQWLSGRDFARNDPSARQMLNLVYAVGDRETGEAMLVDPAYRPDELVSLVRADGMEVTGVLASHYHPDHVGGEAFGADIPGIRQLLETLDVPVHVQRDEVEWVTRTTGVGVDSLVAHESGDVLRVGGMDVTLIHTPGHTPGSQCVLVEQHLLSGDTLFIDGCGRTDLPGSDPEEMYVTLSQRLSQVGDDVVLFPGHLYSSEASANMTSVREFNFVLAPCSREQWFALFA